MVVLPFSGKQLITLPSLTLFFRLIIKTVYAELSIALNSLVAIIDFAFVSSKTKTQFLSMFKVPSLVFWTLDKTLSNPIFFLFINLIIICLSDQVETPTLKIEQNKI
jgi:hypothetical protein